MASHFREYFGGLNTLNVDGSGEPTGEDLQLAAAILLLGVVRGSKMENAEEERETFLAIQREFRIAPERAAKLMEIAGSGRRDRTELINCIESINRSFDDSQKQRILAMIWRVISADGITEQFESEYAAAVRTHLGLTLEQAIRARRLAEGATDLTVQEMVDE